MKKELKIKDAGNRSTCSVYDWRYLYQFTDGPETTEDGNGSTHVYSGWTWSAKRCLNAFQNELQHALDGKDIAPIKVSLVNVSQIGDYQYTWFVAHTKRVSYTLLQTDWTWSAKWCTSGWCSSFECYPPLMKVYKIWAMLKGPGSAPSMIGDTAIHGSYSVPPEGTVQTHVYKVVEHEGAKWCTSSMFQIVGVTRLWMELGDEIKSATEGFADALPSNWTTTSSCNQTQWWCDAPNASSPRLSVHEVPTKRQLLGFLSCK